jgi:propanol-preferring alcohol dehydrogenase
MARLLLGDRLPVLVSDLQPYRLGLVEQLGGIAVDAREQQLADALAARDLPRADLAVDTTGHPEGRSGALGALAQRGALVCVGHGAVLDFDVSRDLIHPERAIVGSEYFPFGLLEDNHRLLLAHRELLAPVITHRFPLERLQEAMQVFLGGSTGKVVVEHVVA